MDNFVKSIIRWGFYLLFFIVPLIFYTGSYELFEYNKMMAAYALTVVIVSAWICRMIIAKKILFRRSYLDIPILIFLASHLISTFTSIDVHISIWGYYSRFHEGLLATISYLLLYYALLANLEKKDVVKILFTSLGSAIIVSLWGWLEHEGHSISCAFIPPYNFDVSCWIQDVKSRVFATLGQPNWMGAYLDVIILITGGIALSIKNAIATHKKEGLFSVRNVVLVVLLALYFAALLFTRSRSSVIGLLVGIITLAGYFLYQQIVADKINFRNFKIPLLLVTTLIIVAGFFGLPFDKIDQLTIPNLLTPKKATITTVATTPKPSDGYIDIGISTSGDIRKIVWKGAIKVWERYPLFGSGVETFALAYYKDRPPEHNYVSEWDFLYNKAHNEFLNVLATTGTVGIVSYLLLIISFGLWTFKKTVILQSNSKSLTFPSNSLLIVSLFAAYITMLITNFFGFSVVIIGLYFYLIPGFCLLFVDHEIVSQNSPAKKNSDALSKNESSINLLQLTLFGVVGLITLFCLISLLSMWLADKEFALGKNYDGITRYGDAEPHLVAAVNQNPDEPTFKDELSLNHSVVASYIWQNASGSAQKNELSKPYLESAIKNSNEAVTQSPNNLIFWKTRTKVFYQLSTIDSKYLIEALNSILRAATLAPTDPKVHYNLAIMYGKTGQTDKAIEAFKETIALKRDYADPRYALALYYKELDRKSEAIEQLNFILTKIGEDKQARDLLDQLR